MSVCDTGKRRGVGAVVGQLAGFEPMSLPNAEGHCTPWSRHTPLSMSLAHQWHDMPVINVSAQLAQLFCFLVVYKNLNFFEFLTGIILGKKANLKKS